MYFDRNHCWLWVILTIALVLRVAAAVLVQQYVARTPGRLCLIAGDAEGYWELGRRLADGQNYEIYQPPRKVLRMPGFPALLAASMSLFGQNVLAARIILALIGTLACGGVYWLGAALFGRNSGLIACALAAISPMFVACSVMILSETVFAAGLLLSLISLAKAIRNLGDQTHQYSNLSLLGWALVSGVCGAIACYVRPSWLLFPPLAAVYLAVIPLKPEQRGSTGKRAAIAAAIVLGLMLGLVPWTVRNYVVTGGHIVPTTLWMGPSLYDGLNPTANGDSHMEFMEQDSLYQSMSEYDVDQHYRKAAWQWAAANPGQTLKLAWIKLGRFWNLWPNTRQFNHWFVRIVLLTYLIPVFGCTFWGLAVGRRYLAANEIPWGWALLLTVGPVVYFSGLHTLFVSSLRYRMPAEYPLWVISAVGFHDLATRMLNHGAINPQNS